MKINKELKNLNIEKGTIMQNVLNITFSAQKNIS